MSEAKSGKGGSSPSKLASTMKGSLDPTRRGGGRSSGSGGSAGTSSSAGSGSSSSSKKARGR